MRISILQTSPIGKAVYTEKQTPTTNANGLISVEIGGGSVLAGNFASINWTAGPYFVKTEVDPSGGSNYSIIGTSQLLSVPYALHAKTADSLVGGIKDSDGNKQLSFSVAPLVSQSYFLMDTIAIKAGKVVTIKGFVQASGSDCTVYLYDLTNGQWVDASFPVWTIYEEEGIGFRSFQGVNGTVVPFSTTKKEFTTYFLPTSDFLLEIRAKEYTATSGNGIGQAAVFVVQ
jgi:hypothetical protein